MKTFLILSLGAAMVLPQSTPSKDPIDPEVYGRVEGILNFCAKVDPPSAAKYQERAKAFTRDQSQSAVDEARKSKEYQDAFDSITDLLSKAPSDDEAVKSCKAFLEGK
jgi:hypothetical protein